MSADEGWLCMMSAENLVRKTEVRNAVRAESTNQCHRIGSHGNAEIGDLIAYSTPNQPSFRYDDTSRERGFLAVANCHNRPVAANHAFRSNDSNLVLTCR